MVYLFIFSLSTCHKYTHKKHNGPLLSHNVQSYSNDDDENDDNYNNNNNNNKIITIIIKLIKHIN